MVEQKFLGSLAAATFLLTYLPHPTFAQPFTEDESGPVAYASYHSRGPYNVETIPGTASVLTEWICEKDGSGGVLITLSSEDFDPKKGGLFLEAHGQTERGIDIRVEALAQLKSPLESTDLALQKDKRFTVFLKARVKDVASIVHELDVFNFCNPRFLPTPFEYERSENFQEQNLPHPLPIS